MKIINVATCNMARSRNPEAIKALRREHDIAVLGLQEVDINAARSGWKHVAQEVAGRENFWSYSESMRFGRLNLPQNSGDISYKTQATNTDKDALLGVAIVSSFPLKPEKVHLGPSVDDYWNYTDRTKQREHEPRSAAVANIEIDGSSLWVISTHLAYTKERAQSSLVRSEQIQKLNSFVDAHIPPEAPLLLLGDFNATPDNPDMRPLMQRFDSLPGILTYPVNLDESPDRQIDYIFYRNLTPATPLRTYENPSVSDHRILMMGFGLQ